MVKLVKEVIKPLVAKDFQGISIYIGILWSGWTSPQGLTYFWRFVARGGSPPAQAEAELHLLGVSKRREGFGDGIIKLPILGGFKQCKYMEILRDFPKNNNGALFGLVSYNDHCFFGWD